MAKKTTARRCLHIKVDGTPCNAYAILGFDYCYFHQADRNRRSSIERALETRIQMFAHDTDRNGFGKSGSVARLFGWDRESAKLFMELDLPAPEDCASINISVSTIIRALSVQQISMRRAGLMLYGLSVALQAIKTGAELAKKDGKADAVKPFSAPPPSPEEIEKYKEQMDELPEIRETVVVGKPQPQVDGEPGDTQNHSGVPSVRKGRDTPAELRSPRHLV